MAIDIDLARNKDLRLVLVPHADVLAGSPINNGTSSFKARDFGTHCCILYDVSYCGVNNNLQLNLALTCKTRPIEKG